MQTHTVTQCSKRLDFQPRRPWPAALPAISWQGDLVCAFERTNGAAIDASEAQRAGLIDTLKACHPELGLAEIARLVRALNKSHPETYQELREGFFRAYDMRWSDRLEETLLILASTPVPFQAWVDEKKLGVRDLSPLLALKQIDLFFPFLSAMSELGFTRSEGVRALELGAELYLMGRPLNDLLPSGDNSTRYLRQLEVWRRPNATSSDESWSKDVEQWPWPAQVQGQWQRFGDQSGLEIKIRTTSAQDLNKKLERLLSIGNTWSTKS